MMKGQYAIFRMKKYKGQTISMIEAHNERMKEAYASNPDIDIQRSKLNFHPIKPNGRYAEGYAAGIACRHQSPECKETGSRD